MKKGSRRKLKKSFLGAILATLIAIAAMGTATFAWYIYNTGAHTTNLNMAAGSSAALLISDEYLGEYKYSIPMKPFVGRLIPVSTDCIRNGFQHVTGYTKQPGREEEIASIFEAAPETEFYKSSLYLKTVGTDMNVYVNDIFYLDGSLENPISTASRVGLVVYEPGSGNIVENEFIFEINKDHVLVPSYNTSTGEEGYVLNSVTKDNTTVKFTPYSSDNFCDVNATEDQVILKPDSKIIAKCLEGGSPVRIDIYIWLEGCDSDCTNIVAGQTLDEVSIKFAGDPIDKK